MIVVREGQRGVDLVHLIRFDHQRHSSFNDWNQRFQIALRSGERSA